MSMKDRLAKVGIPGFGQLASEAAQGEYARSQKETEQRLLDEAHSEYIEAQKAEDQRMSRRGRYWTRDGDRLILDGFPMIAIRRSTPKEVAETYGVGVFCVECETLPPAFPSTLELAKSLGEERAREIDALPLQQEVTHENT